MNVRFFVPWIVLAAILGFALGGTTQQLFWSEAASQAADSSHEIGEHRGRDWWGPEAWLVYVTVPLMAFTGLLFFYTRRLAADAHETAGNEFVATHRPRLRVRDFKLINVGPNSTGLVRFSLTNVGASRAIFLGGKGIMGFFDYLPPVSYVGGTDLATMETFESGALDEQVTVLCPHTLGRIRLLEFGGKPLHVYGYISYRDNLGRTYLTAFCRKYSVHTQRFSKVADDDYEFED